MTDHTGDFRGYSQYSRAWYGKTLLPHRAPAFTDEVTFGFYAPEGGTSGEMQMTWELLGGSLSARLTVWDDTWHALYECKDVLRELAKVDGEKISPVEFCALLTSLGFRDRTQERNPAAQSLEQETA